MDIDAAKELFSQLADEWRASRDAIASEQDARFQVIDRTLVEVLGWHRDEIQTEPLTESAGFVDYLLSAEGRPIFIVEAKRQDSPLVDTKNRTQRWYKAGGAAIASALDGLNQAKQYASDTGVVYSALTNGFQWIAFWASRPDGIAPLSGRAAVFPSLSAIEEKFALFFDLFSRQGVLDRLFRVHIHEAEGLRVAHAENLTSVLPEEDVHLLQKNPLAADLENVYRRYFGSISGDADVDMLAHCFVESRESRDVDDNLRKITRSLISQVDVLESSTGDELQREIRAAVESQQGEFVLIIGNKGAGKSTFIDRFFRLVLKPALRKRCLVLRIDLANSPGDSANVSQWLTNELKEEIERQLFEDGVPTFDDLRGAFWNDYVRWRQGEHKFLYERDRGLFKERFGEWIASEIEKDGAKYVRNLLGSAASQRKLMPCLIFDNTDQFPQEFQESVFQYAQSIYRRLFSFVICPITDRSVWRLSKSGPFQSYRTRTFYLPVPSTKAVIEKRIHYLRKKIADGSTREKGEYPFGKALRLSIDNLDAFAACIEDVLISEDYVGRVIGWLANHDIRRSLLVAQRIILSPVLNVGDLVKGYLVGKRGGAPRLREVKQALLRGEYNHFRQEANDFVLDLFAVEPDRMTSPLIRLSILRLLKDRDTETRERERKYLAVRDIVNYFEPVGYQEPITRDHLKVLLEYGLILPYDPTETMVTGELLVRIAPCGEQHYEFAFASREGSYLTEMALTTPIRRGEFLDLAHGLLRGPKKLGYGDWQRLQTGFASYILQEDCTFTFLPNASSYDGQRALRSAFAAAWGADAAAVGQQSLHERSEL